MVNISKQYQNANKILVVSLFALLMVGYLGVNLLNLTRIEIYLIRSFALIILAGMISQGLRDGWVITSGVKLLGLVALLGALTSSISLNIVFTILFLFGTRNISVRFIAATAASVTGFAILFSLICLYFGFSENQVDTVGQLNYSNQEALRSRMDMGYKNVNAFSGIVTVFCLLVNLLVRNIFIAYAISMAVGWTCFIFTDSRSVVFSLIASILIFSMAAITRRNKSIMAGLIVFSTILIVMVSLVPDSAIQLLPGLDELISNRLLFNSLYFSDLTLINLVLGGAEPNANITVDNSIALILGAVGLPFCLYIVTLTVRAMLYSNRISDFKTLAFIGGVAVYSMSESNIVRPESLIGLVFFVMILRIGNCQSLS